MKPIFLLAASAALAVAFPTRGGVGEAPAPRLEAPPGVAVRFAPEGPVFVDPRGMTLYYDEGPCTAERLARIRPIDAEGNVDFLATVERRRTCVEKNPPFLASPVSGPIGNWTIVERPGGQRQWAYNGRTLHSSMKDKAPGDVNGGYLAQLGRGTSPVAIAPLTGAPAEIRTRETAAGLVLADSKGRTLYVRKGLPFLDGCDIGCARTWPPLAAPGLAGTRGLDPAWSIVSGSGGVRQWAWRGQPLFTYAHDAPAHSEQVFGDVYGGTWEHPIRGWAPAVLAPVAAPPEGVISQTLTGDPQLFSFGLSKTVYADAQGHTLYTMHCIDGGSYDVDEGQVQTGAGVACDDIGDDRRYWLSYCGGEAACARTWRLLPSPGGARPSGPWTVLVVNPRDPFVPLTRPGGERVWAFKGRPVFTYAQDRLPGDFYGDDHGFGTTGFGQMQARPIPAKGFGAIHPPVVALAASESSAP